MSQQLNEIDREIQAVGTVVDLTSAFEGIASMRIAQVKDQAQSSAKFFNDLWDIYSQIRVDELFHFGRSNSAVEVAEKELMILVTSEGGLSGDIDQKLLDTALKNYDSKKHNIIVIGHHGAVRLAQLDTPYLKSFKLPEKDRDINVAPVIEYVQKHSSTTIYYQSYVSLMNQDVKHIKLSTAVAERGKNAPKSGEIISEENYIFEPSTYEVVDYLERSMMQITLSEVILESKLAQYASRFKAMTVARKKAGDSFNELNLFYSRAKRRHKDERLREVINNVGKAAS